ncbi:MAG TPA: ArsB/NhaD family transporter [Syntrophales bacterium]|nr:ArsB/NhaD family transporter [Syntrophales bacterium]
MYLARLLLIVFIGIAVLPIIAPADSFAASDILTVSGVISDAQKKPVKDAEITFFINGNKQVVKEEVTTSKGGQYIVDLELPSGMLPGAKVEMQASRLSYKATERIALQNVVQEKAGEGGATHYLAHQNIALSRAITPGFWVATLVLLAVYGLIAFEWMHRTLAAFLGAALVLTVTYTAGVFNPDWAIITYEDAIHSIDMNVIFLLMAMMIIVGVMKKTGVFQWLAYKSYAIARGNIYILASILMFITAVVSAFLDNVTTMLLIIPVTIEIALTLRINPVALLLPEAFSSNIGGTATLIGDPPNIMIGSYAGLTFMDFVHNLTLICLICQVATIVYFLWWYKKDYLQARVDDIEGTIRKLREEYQITNRKLLIQCSIILALTIFLFIVHGKLKMEPSIAALIGAALLMVISRENIVEMLEKEIEWPTLIFFMMLFIVVAAAEQTGLIQIIADWVRDMSGGSLVIAIVMILWVSAFASAIIDNIPFTATMLPIVAYLTQVMPGAQSGVLWWALSLGACLGGNGTMIGASANVVTVGMAERAGYPISFMEYLKAAFIPMVITVFLCMIWLLVVEI